MKDRYLEVTYRHGQPLAAYLYLTRAVGDHSASTELCGAGLLVDRAQDGRAIGIEIVDPQKVTLASLNHVLSELDETPLTEIDVAPLVSM